jgi:hypothetical protein
LENIAHSTSGCGTFVGDMFTMLKDHFRRMNLHERLENHAESAAHETSLDDCPSWNF